VASRIRVGKVLNLYLLQWVQLTGRRLGSAAR
jgi:hypothetical protein